MGRCKGDGRGKGWVRVVADEGTWVWATSSVFTFCEAPTK